MKMRSVILLGLLSLNSFSAEVDQFTTKNQIINLKDSASVINDKANKVVSDVVVSMNSCDEKLLYKNLRRYFGNHLRGKFTIDLIENNEIEKISTTVDESIYKNWNVLTGTILGNPILAKKGIALSSLVKVGDVVIGTDKFEHLFGRGFSYFTNHYLKNKSIEKTIKTGVFQEKFMFGGIFFETGVFSYGDLSANFNGMRFWNHVLLKNDDVLGKEHNLGPYVKCENDKFVQADLIDFRNYFDESMDESVNCSKYATEKGVEFVKEELEKLNLKCEFKNEFSSKLDNKYGQFTRFLINKDGLEKVSYTGEFKEDESSNK